AQNSKEIGHAVMELFGSQSPRTTIDISRLQHNPWVFKKHPNQRGVGLRLLHLFLKAGWRVQVISQALALDSQNPLACPSVIDDDSQPKSDHGGVF
ncbi:MAG: hypothetical protein ACXABV_19125, partial [Candidatus Thorarchaeota archaeon]